MAKKTESADERTVLPFTTIKALPSESDPCKEIQMQNFRKIYENSRAEATEASKDPEHPPTIDTINSIAIFDAIRTITVKKYTETLGQTSGVWAHLKWIIPGPESHLSDFQED
jgi:hypothetical protein